MKLSASRDLPEHYKVIALFRGPKEVLASNLELWVRFGGNLDLMAIPLNGSAGGDVALALLPLSLPTEVMIRWIRDVDHWTLFYQKHNGAAPPLTPAGIYAQCGFDAPVCDAKLDQADAYAKDGTKFVISGEPRNVFELLDRGTMFFVPPGAKGLLIPQQGSGKHYEAPHTITLSLIARYEERVPTINEDLARVEQQMRELNERRERLLWQFDASESPVWLYIYREDSQPTGGTHWDLRRWFVTASEEDLEPWDYARVDIEHLGVLHLVMPRSFKQTPAARLPLPSYRLRLDPEWRRQRSLMVFVSEGTELYPTPPFENDHVGRLMEAALWQGAVAAAHYLAVIRNYNGEDFRFTIPTTDVRPLMESIEHLNFEVAMQHALRSPTPTLVRQILQDVQTTLQAELSDHVGAMQTALSEIWSGDRADLNFQRSQIGQALKIESEIRSDVGRLDQYLGDLRRVANQNWSFWRDFVKAVLDLDRDLLPHRRDEVRSVLSDLDQVRQEIANRAATPGSARARVEEIVRRLR
jgi:hypothetical protein